jgi:hypothetical protein
MRTFIPVIVLAVVSVPSHPASHPSALKRLRVEWLYFSYTWIVKGHQEHPGRDADPCDTRGDRRGCGQNRREIAVVDEVVLRQPHVVKAVVLAPHDLIKNLSIEPVGSLAPLGWIAEVVPQTKAYLLTILTHGRTFLWNDGVPRWLNGVFTVRDPAGQAVRVPRAS